MSLAVEDLINQALDAIGYPGHIADIYEGSPAARVGLEIYSLTRDALLENGEWPFALREVVLTANGQTAPSPWAFEYTYPADCLRIRYVRPGPLTGGTLDFDPQPILFRPWNDNRPGTPLRAILCSLAAPVLIYNGKITDPGTWGPAFTKALVSALAEKMAFMLGQGAETAKAAIGLAQRDMTEGQAVDDISSPQAGMVVNGH